MAETEKREPTQDIIDSVKSDARSKLLDLLDDVAGRKILILDSAFLGPLDLIVNTSDLKDHGVQHWFKLTEQVVTTECAQMIFLVRCSRMDLVDMIATQILGDEAQGRDRMYEVVFVPRRTEQCVERLGRGNVRANVRIVEYGLHFFPFDRDILSMEMPGVFQDFHVQGDPSTLFYAAKSLMFLQAQFGVTPSVHAIGSAAKCVLDIMLRLRKEDSTTDASKEPKPMREFSQPGVPPVAPHQRRGDDSGSVGSPAGTLSKITELILIDRRVDLFSILCSQFTYQALIDMEFGIQNNTTDVSGTEWAKDRNHTQVRLSPEEPLIQEIKDLHIDDIGPLLQQRAVAIQETYAEKDSVRNPNDMAEYIKKFKKAQSVHPLLEIHINLARHLKTVISAEEYRSHLRIEDDITAQNSQCSLEAIEDFIDDQKPWYEIFRLLSLCSLVNNGIKPKQLDSLKKGIIQAFGYEHVLTLSNMEKVGVLRYAQGKSVYSSIKQKFTLFPEDAVAARDISYAYSGYAPLSARLVQMTSRQPSGWRSCQDALSLLWGPATDLQQQPSPHASGSVAEHIGAMDDAAAQNQAVQAGAVALVCFLGGVTYGEIAALRRLSELEGGRRKFLICTTEFMNSKKFFESLRCEQVLNKPLDSKRPAVASEHKKSGGGGLGGFWPGGR